MAAKRQSGQSEARRRRSTATIGGHERGKDFLSEKEVERVVEGARQARHGTRDRLIRTGMACVSPRRLRCDATM
jgi:hypothetical protein